MATEPIRIGYVPEHFSTPLYIARDSGYFAENNVNVELVCCPGGTGEMTQMLHDRKLDLAIALTEGLVAGISKGQDWYKIVGTYVEAPLCWAISTGKDSKHGSIDTLDKATVAISRFGSGSHIMAYVLADQQGWLAQSKDPFQFQALSNFQAMRDAVNSSACDFFMWETFTTKPYHDSGEVKRIGQITPPWPAFLFAAHVDVDMTAVQRILKAVQLASTIFMAQKDGASIKRVIDILGYDEADVRNWFKTVRYAQDMTQVSRRALEVTGSTLVKAGVLSEVPNIEDLCVASLSQ